MEARLKSRPREYSMGAFLYYEKAPLKRYLHTIVSEAARIRWGKI